MNERVPEPEVWIARLREIRHACVNGAPDIEADLVREAAHLLQSGPFFGIPTQLVDPAELAAMTRSYDSLFHGHMDGAATGHPGLVQAPVADAPIEWVFGPTLWALLRSCALQLLRAARRAEGLCECSRR